MATDTRASGRIQPGDGTLRSGCWAALSWAARGDYAGYHPGDALASRRLSSLCSGSAGRLAAGWLLAGGPPSVRSLLEVPETRRPESTALYASAWLDLGRATGDRECRRRASELLEWLVDHTAAGGAGWSHGFDWQRSRAAFLQAGQPTLPVTVRCARAFLNHYARTGNRESLSVTRETIESVRSEWRRPTVDGRAAVALTPDGGQVSLAATALAAGLFARVADRTNDPGLLASGTELARLVAGAQGTAGVWPPGQAVGRCPRDCDTVRLGVILDGLGEYLRYTCDSAVETAYLEGLERYQREGFVWTNSSGCRYGPHCVGQALLTAGRHGGPTDVAGARNAAVRAVAHLDGDGRYRPPGRLGAGAAHRCGGQAWLCRGLAAVLARAQGAR